MNFLSRKLVKVISNTLAAVIVTEPPATVIIDAYDERRSVIARVDVWLASEILHDVDARVAERGVKIIN